MNTPNYPDTMTETSSRDPWVYRHQMLILALILALWAALGTWQSWSGWQLFLIVWGGGMATGLAVIGANTLLLRLLLAVRRWRSTAGVAAAGVVEGVEHGR